MAITSRTVNYFPSETMNPLSHIVLPEKTFATKSQIFASQMCKKVVAYTLDHYTLDYRIYSTGH